MVIMKISQASIKIINWNNVGILEFANKTEESINYTNIEIDGHRKDATMHDKLLGGKVIYGLFPFRKGRLSNDITYKTWYHILIDGHSIYKSTDKRAAHNQFLMYEKSQRNWFDSLKD